MSKVEMHPTFRHKVVYNLECASCDSTLCRRGMQAILLADTKTEMFSTDVPVEDAIGVIEGLISTSSCACKLQDVACIVCGNIVGYHVSLPCRKCLQSCNNGHFWMYYSAAVIPVERIDYSGESFLLWGQLPSVHDDHNIFLEAECCR